MASTPFLVAVVWGSVAVVGASAALAWRQRPRPGATAFAVAMLAATWWVAAASLGLFTTDPAMRVFWAKVEWGGAVAFPLAWLAFALAYTGRSEWVTPRRLGALGAVPSVTLALALTNGVAHRLVYRSTEYAGFGSVSLLYQSFGPWFWVHAAYSTLLLVTGGALVVRLATQRRLLYRGQVSALVLVVLAPLVGSAVYVAGLSPVPAFDPTPYAFVVSGGAGLAALSQFSFLDAVPVPNRVARKSVVENVDAGVVVADTTGRVVDANPRAVELLNADDPLHQRVREVLPSDALTDERLDEDERSAGDASDGGERPATEPTVSDEGTVAAVEYGDGERFYEVSETALTDSYGNATGRIYLVRDATDRQVSLQRLSVLNRVLRHNLRNEMNVFYGHADALEHGNADPASVAADVREKAEDLIDLSERAREIDAILDDDRGTTDAARMVEIECQRVTDEYPEVRVDVETPDGPLPVDGAAGIVVSNLVENAARHNTAPDPTVTVTLTAPGERVTVRVADDGPGIPDQERAALDADLETQLDHASGLGLWLANWGATEAGGDLEVADRAEGGTVATVEFPRVDGDDDASERGRQ